MIQLLEGETIIAIKRKHWFVIAVEAAVLLLLAIMPLVVLVLFNIINPAMMVFVQDYWVFIIFYGASWLLFLWLVFTITWTNYYLDVLVITNKRIIDIEQFSLFVRDFAELRLENVQDMKVEVIGFVQSFFKIGNIHIQTAGQTKEILFRNVPDPYGLKHIISSHHDQILKGKPLK